MIFDDIPFWNLLIYMMLPVIIAVLIFIRSISIFKKVIENYKKKETEVFMEIGTLLLFLVALSVIIGLIFLIATEDLNGGDIFEFLVYDMLPTTIYTILLYGILAELNIMMNRRSGGVK